MKLGLINISVFLSKVGDMKTLRECQSFFLLLFGPCFCTLPMIFSSLGAIFRPLGVVKSILVAPALEVKQRTFL